MVDIHSSRTGGVANTPQPACLPAMIHHPAAHLVREGGAKQAGGGEEDHALGHQARRNDEQQAAGDDEEPFEALDGAAPAR